MGSVLIISCVMAFGWNGSPGEYMASAWGAKDSHASYRPPQPEVNDTVAFAAHWLLEHPRATGGDQALAEFGHPGGVREEDLGQRVHQ